MSLADRADAGRAWREALERLARLVYGLGWLTAKAVVLALTALGALFFGAGWVARRALWPALKWLAAAFMVGYETAAPPGKRGRDGA